VRGPEGSDDWFSLTDQVLSVGEVHDWAVRPHCGAVVVFSGTVRDHAEGRADVVALTYEAYTEQVEPIFAEIASHVRREWPDVARVAIHHRVGRLELGEVSVVVGVSSPHRPVAFEAARHAIDTLKVSAPIWKREEWAEGSDWGTGATPVRRPDEVSGADS
jgi:molybdopterin synthase catalytic subunit